MHHPWIHFPVDETILKCVLSCLLCGLIGLEREYRQKTAGFRTHLLVGLGSTMFTLLSMFGFGSADPSRVAAQIVSGIGFIGAGAILRQGLSVRGLTTAATLWLVASIGMAVGVGWYEPALISTGLALLALILLSNIERFVPIWPTPVVVQLKLGIHPDLQGLLTELLAEGGWTVRRGQLEKHAPDLVRLNYLLRRNDGSERDLQALLQSLETLEGVRELGWEVIASAQV